MLHTKDFSVSKRTAYLMSNKNTAALGNRQPQSWMWGSLRFLQFQMA